MLTLKSLGQAALLVGGAVFLLAILGPWIAWFWPAVLAIAAIKYVRRMTTTTGVLLVCAGGALSGVWALFLLSFGARLPQLLQEFLTLHIDPDAQPTSDPYAPVRMSGPDFLGIVYFLSAMCAACFLALLLAGISLHVVKSRASQIWLFRFSVLVLFGGGCLVAWTRYPSLATLLIFPVFIIGLPALFAPGPHDLWRD